MRIRPFLCRDWGRRRRGEILRRITLSVEAGDSSRKRFRWRRRVPTFYTEDALLEDVPGLENGWDLPLRPGPSTWPESGSPGAFPL